MILGRMGRLPGELNPEIVALAAQKGYELYEGNPQDEFPNELDRYRQMMEAEGWDCGQDDEELFEFAMHERQYRDYKSGVAKERFNKELEVARTGRTVPVQAPAKGQMLWQLDVTDISSAPVVGTRVKAGEVVGYVQTYYGPEEIVSAADGVLAIVTAQQGASVSKGEIVARIEKL